MGTQAATGPAGRRGRAVAFGRTGRRRPGPRGILGGVLALVVVAAVAMVVAAATADPETIRYEITGKGQANVTWTTGEAGAAPREGRVDLPWRLDVACCAADTYTIRAVSQPLSTRIECAIVVDGEAAVRRSGTGRVTCEWASP